MGPMCRDIHQGQAVWHFTALDWSGIAARFQNFFNRCHLSPIGEV
jgi:hypothetical protein